MLKMQRVEQKRGAQLYGSGSSRMAFKRIAV